MENILKQAPENKQQSLFSLATLKRILILGVPVVFGQLAHFILNFADRFFIAKLGINEAAGASLSTSLMWVLFSFTTLVSGGTIALVSRKIGEKNQEEAASGSEQSFLMSFFLGIGLTAGCFFYSEHIISFFKVEPEVYKLGLDYFSVIICCFPAVIMSQTIWAIFQAAGDTKTPMIIFSAMSLINLVIDPFLIFDSFCLFNITIYGFGLGIKGAGCATVIAEFWAIVVLIIELYRLKKIEIKPFWKILPEICMIKRILKVGFWTGINSFSRPLSTVFMQRILAFHGTNALAAFTFGLQWITFIFLFYEGIRVAVSTMVGRNLGRKDILTTKKTIFTGMVLGYLIICVFLLLGALFAEQAIVIFSNDPEIISIGSKYLHIVLIGMIFSVPMNIYSAVFNGAGDTMPPMIIAFISNWPGKVGIAYISTYLLGYDVNGIWAAVAISIFMEGSGVYLWSKKGNWKHKII